MKEKDQFVERLERLGEAFELSCGYRLQMGRRAAACLGFGATLVMVGLAVWILATQPADSRDFFVPHYPVPVARPR